MADISIDNLAEAINEEVAKYGKAIKEETKKLIRDAGKRALEETKARAPVRTGDYQKSIRVTYNQKEAGVISTGESAGYALIYAQAPHYRLTHLLENGHALRQGGRARAFPHWSYGEQAAEETLDQLPKRLEEVT